MELMSLHGIIENDLNEEIQEMCFDMINELELSDHFFRIPLHISLKRSFHTNEFEAVSDDVHKMLSNVHVIRCRGLEPVVVKNRLWLKVNEYDELKLIHQELDRMLLQRHGIPIDEFDRIYCPHISLFNDSSDDKLLSAANMIRKDPDREFLIHRYSIGSNKHPSSYCDFLL